MSTFLLIVNLSLYSKPNQKIIISSKINFIFVNICSLSPIPQVSLANESAESLSVVLMNAACHCCMRGRMEVKRVSGSSQVVMRRLLSTIIIK